MMNHKEVLETAAATVKDRADLYGSEEALFERVCMLYSAMTDQQITPYEVNTLMVCIKLARMRFDRKVADNYIDAINYMSFMAQFAGAQNPVPVQISVPSNDTVTMAITDDLEDDIKAIADKFKPITVQE